MKNFLLLIAASSVLFLWACGGDAPVAGVYEAKIPNLSHGGDAPEFVEVALELKAGGEGSWTTQTDAAPVKWDVRDARITLHGKSGGVMTGVATGEGLRIFIPGAGEVVFVRKKQ